MRLVAGLVAACTITAVAAVPATAAPKKKPKPIPKVCNIIVDDASDAALQPGAPSDDAVDIVGGDFASNGKKLTGVIKLKALTTSNPRSPLGQAFFVIFTIKGSTDTLTLSAVTTPSGNQFTYGYQGDDPNTGVSTSYTLGDAVGEIKGNEIRITAEIAKFPQKNFLKNGGRVTALTAESRYLYGQRAVPSQQAGPVRVPLGGLTLRLDEGTGKQYTLGAPSCIAIK